MNKPEKYILGVNEMKHLKELGLDIESDNDSVVYWVRFVQTQGKRKCHKWKKSIRSARELNRKCPQYGHYIGMPAYTLQQIMETINDDTLGLKTMSEDKTLRDGHMIEDAYKALCELLGDKADEPCQQ